MSGIMNMVSKFARSSGTTSRRGSAGTRGTGAAGLGGMARGTGRAPGRGTGRSGGGIESMARRFLSRGR